jgi:dipeptidyl aminopeptidase/acylaminoacyl peptidase
LLTNWVVGQTNRFAAAVAQRDIASWTDWWYTADFTLFRPNWFKAPPFEEEQDFKARSAITYIKNVKTPMMFILGESITARLRERAVSKCFVRSSFVKFGQ